jgi:hypothetical protein
MNYGPTINESYKYNAALNRFIISCTKYVSDLSPFNRYIIWRYTIGSGSINSYLITNKISDNAIHWTYYFFLYHYNTYHSSSNVSYMVSRWNKYFDNPRSYLSLSKSDQTNVAISIIQSYIILLQKIIINAPTPSDTFKIFKVASKYPGLPDTNNQLPAKVVQLPFNSTTVSPYFNFEPFISPSATCCLFNITVTKGSHCLYIPSEFHAYPFEHEIILPKNCIFNIKSINREIVNYVDPDSVNIVSLQNNDNIRLGSVYQINEYFPCSGISCGVHQKSFTVYYTEYLNPK